MKKLRNILVATLALGFIGMHFQNCSEVSFTTADGDGGNGKTDLEPGDPFSKTLTVTGNGEKKADVLFLIDTSGSMNYEQTQIRDRFQGFIASLNGLNWRVAIATMLMKDALQKDVSGSNTNQMVEGANGRLIPFQVGVNYLTSAMNMTTATNLFQSKIQRAQTCGFGNDDCNDHERGIYNASLLIDTKASHGFFRDDSDLNLIFVSDEDERSNGNNLEALDLPENLINKVDSDLNARSFTAHSIIYVPGAANCAEGTNRGDIYYELSQLTAGSIGSVCENDYTEQLDIIAENIVKTADSLVLPCDPEPASLDVDITPPPSGTAVTSYTLVGRKLQFASQLPVGQVVRVTGICQ